MKFSLLKKIIQERADRLKDDAACMGALDDGGCRALLGRLKEFQEELVIKLDLRPSEFGQLEDLEIGEPDVFSKEIKQYKIKLAEKIIL